MRFHAFLQIWAHILGTKGYHSYWITLLKCCFRILLWHPTLGMKLCERCGLCEHHRCPLWRLRFIDQPLPLHQKSLHPLPHHTIICTTLPPTAHWSDEQRQNEQKEIRGIVKKQALHYTRRAVLWYRLLSLCIADTAIICFNKKKNVLQQDVHKFVRQQHFWILK